jgi:hypothetical protein
MAPFSDALQKYRMRFYTFKHMRNVYLHRDKDRYREASDPLEYSAGSIMCRILSVPGSVPEACEAAVCDGGGRAEVWRGMRGVSV